MVSCKLWHLGDGRGKKKQSIQRSDTAALQRSLKCITIKHYEIWKLHLKGLHVFICERIVTHCGKWDLPRLSLLPIKACGLCSSCSNDNGLWISLWSARLWFSTTVKRMEWLYMHPSASSGCLSLLCWRRGTVANVSSQMESANIN